MREVMQDLQRWQSEGQEVALATLIRVSGSAPRPLGSKLAIYTMPRRKSRKELQLAEEILLASTQDMVLAHVGSSDALQHLDA